MNVERIALTLFVKYIKQINLISGHLQNSFKEILLASSSLLNLTSQISNNTPVLRNFKSVENTFQKLSELIESSALLIHQPQNHKNNDTTKTKREIIESIIMTIDDEIEVISESSQNNIKLKIEALNTVKTVLLSHIRPLNDNSDTILASKALSNR